MENHKVVSRGEWLEARKQFLAEEKEFTRQRDRLSQRRRELPWERVDKQYVFDGPDGAASLSELFAGRKQLIVYHFMFDPEWGTGCKHCSFWADNFNGIDVHLNQRDVSLVAISRAPLAKLQAFKKRMGWSFKWLSSFKNDFNRDYQVSFTPEEVAKGEAFYNYTLRKPSSTEGAGISAFYKDTDGNVYHTYSCYARGLDMVNGAYHFLDLAPMGRAEGDLPFAQAWVRYHDEYGK
jgi:predicted dithiol-disulfide oxidoreductase (DUF899 family)